MIRPNLIVVLLCSALATGTVACGRPAATPAASSQGTTHVYAENRVSGPVDLQQISVAIDGEDMGGLVGEGLGRGSTEPLHIAAAQLTQGTHVLTVHARAAHRATADVLVLNETQKFSVGREPVAVTARLSVPSGEARHARLHVDFAMEGGTLDGATPPSGIPSSCHALTPERTEICVTEAMLREAIADHDAPRVVCVDDALTQMRRWAQFNRTDVQPTAAAASPQESAVTRDASFRIAVLAEGAKRCPSVQASVLTDQARR